MTSRSLSTFWSTDLFVALTVASNHSRPYSSGQNCHGRFFDVIAAGGSFGGNRQRELKARHC
jgi:hypothetical protein